LNRGPTRNEAAAALAIAGVASFVLAWTVLGAIREGYSPIEDAISRLAELGAPHRELMTAAIVAFGAGCLAFGWTLGRRGGAALVLAGVGSLAVAAFPCTEGCPGAGEATDNAHSAAAALHYVSFALAPIVLSRDRRSLIVSAVAATALGLHGLGLGPSGLLQRIGLSVLDAWLVIAALRVLRGSRSAGA
jgi:hypothetical membrane protein